MSADDPTPTELRDQAYALTIESAWSQRLAFYLSSEWRQLGFSTFAEWNAAHADRLGVKFDSIERRREQVRELTAAAVPVADQAALLGVHANTVKNDRRTILSPKPVAVGGESPAPQTIVSEPEPDIDALPPDPAVAAAAAAAIRAEREALTAAHALQTRAQTWSRASDAMRVAADELRKALRADPNGDAARNYRPDVAGEYLDLLAARADVLAELINTTRMDVLNNSGKLRRIK